MTYHASDGLRKWLFILCRKSQGTTPGNCKVVGSHLQSELIFRIHNYEFSHRNNRLGSSSPSRLSKSPSFPANLNQNHQPAMQRATIASNLGVDELRVAVAVWRELMQQKPFGRGNCICMRTICTRVRTHLCGLQVQPLDLKLQSWLRSELAGPHEVSVS